MSLQVFHRILGRALILATVLLAGPAQAENVADIYQQELKAYAQTKQVTFRDDHTDVAGRAYDLAKASLNWLGVPGPVLDAADFARSIKNEGLNSHNTMTLVAKVLASEASVTKLSDSIKSMPQGDLVKLAKDLGISDIDGDLQKNILELLTETAPKAGASVADDAAYQAAGTIIVDVVTKFCKTCDVAHKSYLFAKEAAAASDVAFDNARTQSMFAQMDAAGFYDYKSFKEEFAGGDFLKSGARKALTLLNKSRGLPPPDDEAVMRYIFNRYQRWQTEVKTRAEEAEVLAGLEDEYLGLLGYQRDAMFGAGSAQDQIKVFMAKYLDLYRKVTAMKGDNPWPFGGGREMAEHHIFDLMKKQLSEGLSEAEVDYEARRMAASWGWISESAVGAPPPGYNSEQFRSLEEQEAHIRERLSKLDYNKLMAVMDQMQIALPDSFMQCLCSIDPAGTGSVGYIRTPREDCPGPCTGGVINCVSWTPRADADGWVTCMNRVSMPNGMRIDEYIALTLQREKNR